MPEDSQWTLFFLYILMLRTMPWTVLQSVYSVPFLGHSCLYKQKLELKMKYVVWGLWNWSPNDLYSIVGTHSSLLLPLSRGRIGRLKTWNHFVIQMFDFVIPLFDFWNQIKIKGFWKKSFFFFFPLPHNFLAQVTLSVLIYIHAALNILDLDNRDS